jgi:hypothetical protein
MIASLVRLWKNLIHQNSKIETIFYNQCRSTLAKYLFITILSMPSLFRGRLVIPHRGVLECFSTQLYFMSAILA